MTCQRLSSVLYLLYVPCRRFLSLSLPLPHLPVLSIRDTLYFIFFSLTPPPSLDALRGGLVIWLPWIWHRRFRGRRGEGG
jgi:hypothetical protein